MKGYTIDFFTNCNLSVPPRCISFLIYMPESKPLFSVLCTVNKTHAHLQCVSQSLSEDNILGYSFINKYNTLLALTFLFNCFIIVILTINLAYDNSVLL